MSPSEPNHENVSPAHNVGNWIEVRACEQADAVALRFEGRSTTYRELADRIAQLGTRLLEAGVTRGDRVAILLDNQPAWLEIFLAGIRIGALSLPLNGRLTAPELAFILDDAGPGVVVTDASHASLLDATIEALPQENRPTRLSLEALGIEGVKLLPSDLPAAPVAAVSPDDPMMLMYTSGTTGHPKGAVLSHRKALFNCLNAEVAFELDSRDRGLVVAPLFHSLGIQILSLPLLHAGATVVLQRRFEAESVARCIEEEGVTMMGGVPTFYERILGFLRTRPDEELDLGSLRFLFTAGAAVSAGLVRDYAHRGLDLRQGYGQTETSLLCALSGADALRKAGSVGRPLPHCELRIIDRESLHEPPDDWRECPVNEIGEIVVRGPIVMTGYWNAPEDTAMTLRDGWVLTGDLARMDSEGFVYLEGRSREMYISGGENVYPAEVEATYARHPAIREIAVIAQPDPEWGEIGAAFVVWNDDRECDEATLADWGRERLAAYKIPRHFHFLDELPRTASGKVRKHLLRD